jgi:hypothetical protein
MDKSVIGRVMGEYELVNLDERASRAAGTDNKTCCRNRVPCHPHAGCHPEIAQSCVDLQRAKPRIL